MLHYFVSYFFSGCSGNFGFANVEIPIDRPITTIEDIKAIAKCISEQNPNLGSVCVLNYILMREDTDA